MSVRQFPMPRHPTFGKWMWCKWCGKEIPKVIDGKSSTQRYWHPECAHEYNLHTRLETQYRHLVDRDGERCQLCPPSTPPPMRWLHDDYGHREFADSRRFYTPEPEYLARLWPTDPCAGRRWIDLTDEERAYGEHWRVWQVVALEVDHRDPLWEVAGLPDDQRRWYFGPGNLWLLCPAHHREKSRLEAGRRALMRKLVAQINSQSGDLWLELCRTTPHGRLDGPESSQTGDARHPRGVDYMHGTLMTASRQWATRPDDQRFTSLDQLLEFTRAQREASRSLAVSSRRIEARPIEGDNRGLAVLGPDGAPTLPTHWAFGQLAARIKAPAGYLRTLPSDIAADAINHGLQHRGIEDVGALLRLEPDLPAPQLAAMTGPNYGRVWNADVVAALRERFGDGVTGDFTVPGEFGQQVEVTKANTTLYASDRDMFVFLADEKNRIWVPNRRNGEPGTLARGFFVWNSEVGSSTLGIATFFFDYVCCNRIVWGPQGYQEIKIRHTVSAPDRFLEEAAPALESYAQSSSAGITDAIAAAQQARIGDKEEVVEFLVKKRRFSATQAQAINLAHENEEGRPIETLWDATVGVTAYAKGLKHQDARVDLERKGGDLMRLAA